MVDNIQVFICDHGHVHVSFQQEDGRQVCLSLDLEQAIDLSEVLDDCVAEYVESLPDIDEAAPDPAPPHLN